MLKIIKNELDGKYASPINHPVTCANPKPWLIEELSIKFEYDSIGKSIWKLWIRNSNSMWFRVDQCYIGTKEELEELEL